MNSSAVQRMTLEDRLHKALGNRELSLHYQPQVALTSGCILLLREVGEGDMEARWRESRSLQP